MPDPAPAPTVVGQQPIGVREQSPASNDLPTPGQRPPRRNPTLSRDDMLQVIRGGGSVLHRGEVIAHERQLPSEEEMAAGDAEKEEALRSTVAAQIGHLSAVQDRLARSKPADKPKPDAPADKPK